MDAVEAGWDVGLDWREQDDWSTLTPIWDQMTMEQQRQRLVEYLLRGRPGMTREEATEQIDAFS
jgi:hypothetical protein